MAEDPVAFEREAVRRKLHEIAQEADKLTEDIARGEQETLETIAGLRVGDIALSLQLQGLGTIVASYQTALRALLPDKEEHEVQD